MKIILNGSRREVRRWIRRQRHMTGANISYIGCVEEDGTCTYIVKEGTKNDYPRQRIVIRKARESEKIGEGII